MKHFNGLVIRLREKNIDDRVINILNIYQDSLIKLKSPKIIKFMFNEDENKIAVISKENFERNCYAINNSCNFITIRDQNFLKRIFDFAKGNLGIFVGEYVEKVNAIIYDLNKPYVK